MERDPIPYEVWKSERGTAGKRAEEIDRTLPPHERTRPRDPDEARVLRRFGTPEALIGSSRDSVTVYRVEPVWDRYQHLVVKVDRGESLRSRVGLKGSSLEVGWRPVAVRRVNRRKPQPTFWGAPGVSGLILRAPVDPAVALWLDGSGELLSMVDEEDGNPYVVHNVMRVVDCVAPEGVHAYNVVMADFQASTLSFSGLFKIPQLLATHIFLADKGGACAEFLAYCDAHPGLSFLGVWDSEHGPWVGNLASVLA